MLTEPQERVIVYEKAKEQPATLGLNVCVAV